jgi:hypothetical protein
MLADLKFLWMTGGKQVSCRYLKSNTYSVPAAAPKLCTLAAGGVLILRCGCNWALDRWYAVFVMLRNGEKKFSFSTKELLYSRDLPHLL